MGAESVTESLKIGDPLWRFDENRRVYPKTEEGRRFGGGAPIYREHFSKYIIRDEIRGYWIIEPEAWKNPSKVNKKTLRSSVRSSRIGFQYFTEAAMEDSIWLHENRGRILDTLRSAPPAIWRAIANILKVAI